MHYKFEVVRVVTANSFNLIGNKELYFLDYSC